MKFSKMEGWKIGAVIGLIIGILTFTQLFFPGSGVLNILSSLGIIQFLVSNYTLQRMFLEGGTLGMLLVPIIVISYLFSCGLIGAILGHIFLKKKR